MKDNLLAKRNKIKGYLASHNMTQNDLADYLHITRSSLSYKINGRAYFTEDELCKIVELTGLDIFFE